MHVALNMQYPFIPFGLPLSQQQELRDIRIIIWLSLIES